MSGNPIGSGGPQGYGSQPAGGVPPQQGGYGGPSGGFYPSGYSSQPTTGMYPGSAQQQFSAARPAGFPTGQAAHYGPGMGGAPPGSFPPGPYYGGQPSSHMAGATAPGVPPFAPSTATTSSAQVPYGMPSGYSGASAQLHPTQPAAMAGGMAANAAQPGASSQQQQPSASSSSAATSSSKLLHAYSLEVLNNLHKYNVPDLCAIGRELVSELTYRTSHLCGALKAHAERKPGPTQGGDPEVLLEYCQMILKKIVEIRLRIEKNMPKNKISADDFLEMLTQPGEADEPSLKVKQYQATFAANRETLISLSSDLKMLDWLATVSDPGQLKRTEVLKNPTQQAKESAQRASAQ